ncbi:peroxide stress protein YaaA [Leucobacter sp. gxy201]|uniref:YaaA family protein n=1 Tax=Leucobacter sp. gxy201 TaxID=2957200 RepID=UPI003D9FCE9C
MLVLLPPSETKRVGGAGTLELASLHGHDALGDARVRVRDALVELSRGDEEVAAKALKLGVKNRGELAYNLALESGGVMPAIERYTGVVYDALDVSTLDDTARGWIDAHVRVQSALFGLVSARDAIPAYRLSAGSRLPALGAPLKRIWGDAHARLEWPEDAFVLDLRSKDYAALAPVPAELGWHLHVVQRSADGAVRALNHFNKAAKGDLVRRLAESCASPRDAAELGSWAGRVGLEMSFAPGSRTITLVTELGVPVPSA